MNVWGIIGVCISILALAGSIMFHLFKTTWWMATLTVSLTALKDSVEDIKKVIARFEAIKYTTEDAARDFAIRDAQIKAMWNRVDELSDQMKGKK